MGPTLGGLLYEYGGFPTPFNVLGVLLFIAAVITYAILPNSESCDLIPEGILVLRVFLLRDFDSNSRLFFLSWEMANEN